MESYVIWSEPFWPTYQQPYSLTYYLMPLSTDSNIQISSNEL